MDPIDVDYEIVSPAPAKATRQTDQPKGWCDEFFYTLEALGWLALAGVAMYGIDKLLHRLVIG